MAHARDVVGLERSLHVFVEGRVQDAAQAVPGLIDVLGIGYLTLHLAVTAGVLLWLHQRRPAAFPFVRTTLLLASGLALVGFVAYPTAPPRLAGIGIADTVSGDQIDLNEGLVSSLYNPYAAIPSMHVGYALVVGATLLRSVRLRIVRVAGVLYPLLVFLVVVATGNHFLVDAFAGAAVVVVAAGGALLLAPPAVTMGCGGKNPYFRPLEPVLSLHAKLPCARQAPRPDSGGDQPSVERDRHRSRPPGSVRPAASGRARVAAAGRAH